MSRLLPMARVAAGRERPHHRRCRRHHRRPRAGFVHRRAHRRRDRQGARARAGVPARGASARSTRSRGRSRHDDVTARRCRRRHARRGLPGAVPLRRRQAVRLTPDRVAKPADVAAEWADSTSRSLLAGNGLRKYADVFAEALGRARHVRRRGALAAVRARPVRRVGGAARRAASAGSGDPADVLPVYTRLSDAEENERTRAGLPSARRRRTRASSGR